MEAHFFLQRSKVRPRLQLPACGAEQLRPAAWAPRAAIETELSAPATRVPAEAGEKQMPKSPAHTTGSSLGIGCLAGAQSFLRHHSRLTGSRAPGKLFLLRRA